MSNNLNFTFKNNRVDGFVNIGFEGGDVAYDSAVVLPFENDSIESIHCQDFIEYLPQRDAAKFLRECRRILSGSGVMRIITPDLDGLIRSFYEDGWQSETCAGMDDWIDNRGEYLNLKMRDSGIEWVYTEADLVRLANFVGLTHWRRIVSDSSAASVERKNNVPVNSFISIEFSKEIRSLGREPLVTIVMPVYRDEYFEESIRSALAQTYEKIEIVVLDDSDNGNIKSIVDKLNSSNRISYVKNSPRLGEIASLTRGIGMARGALIKPLYDDDLLAPSCVERMVLALQVAPGATLASSKRRIIDDAGDDLGEMPFNQALVGRDSEIDGLELVRNLLTDKLNRIGEPSTVMFYKHDALAIQPAVMCFSGVPMNGVGDVALYLNLLSRGNAVYLSDTLSAFRMHENQSQSQPGVHEQGIKNWEFLRRHAERLGLYNPAGTVFEPLQREGDAARAAEIIDDHSNSAEASPSAEVVDLPRTAVLLHLFYPDLWGEISSALRGLGVDVRLFVSLSGEAVALEQTILKSYGDAVIRYYPNRGRDIAPRLALAREASQMGYELMLFIHGKKSPHLKSLNPNWPIPEFLKHRDGAQWRRQLIDSLIGSHRASGIVRRFKENSKLGFVGPAGFWMGLDNSKDVADFALRMGIALDSLEQGFFAGSMFWARSSALRPLLELNLGFDDFPEERGQLDGTLAHVIERIFAVVAEKNGFSVEDSSGVVFAMPANTVANTRFPVAHLPGEQDWVGRTLREHEGELFVNGNESNPAGADVGVFVRQDVNGSNAIVDTRASLSEQWIAPIGECYAGDSNLEILNEQVRGSSNSWVLFLREGDVCEPSFLARMAIHILQNPDCVMIYFDESQYDKEGRTHGGHYKPDFNLDYLRSLPYTGNAFAVRKNAFEALGGFDPQFAGLEEYDFTLRLFERYGERAIGHISGVLIAHLAGVNLSDVPLAQVLESGRTILAAHLKRLGMQADVLQGELPATFRVRYTQTDRPWVSIIVPTRDQQPVLQRCLESILKITTYPHYEILIVDNGSRDQAAVEYLDGLRALESEVQGRVRVLDYPHAFNYSAMNNLAAAEARGEYLLLLNNDTAVLHADWLDEMLCQAQRDDVGVVGAKLLFPDGKVQHAGVILGMKGPAEHPFVGHDPKSPGYFARLQVVQDYSAVTGACLMVRKSLYEEVGGLDAAELAVSYSDIDLCLKIGKLGKRVVWTPHAILMHEGSKSQKSDVESVDDRSKLERFAREQAVMYRRWMPALMRDPAYNSNLSLASTDFVVESDPALSWDSVWRPVPRILTQPADRMGCGEYRIIAPTRALLRAGLIQGQETDRIYTPPELARIKPDALVLQRQVEPFQIEAIERHKRFNPDVFCVFEIDDLVTNVPLKNIHRSLLPKDMYKRMRRAVAACDCLVVATEPLAEAYRDLASDIRVVPNFIESAVWGSFEPVRRMSKKPRVGWAGGVSHTGDLEIIARVVEALQDEVDWVFFGMCPPALRACIKEYHEPVPIGEYPAKLASLNLDLAIAPLEDVPFNHAKSHLRLLEYGMLGYPVVCSDLTPYQGGFPVTRVRNRFKEWVDAIRAHALDADVAALAGDRLRDHVREHWLLENNLDAWLAAWLP